MPVANVNERFFQHVPAEIGHRISTEERKRLRELQLVPEVFQQQRLKRVEMRFGSNDKNGLVGMQAVSDLRSEVVEEEFFALVKLDEMLRRSWYIDDFHVPV